MIFDDLLTKLVDRLNSDAFFSDPARGVKAIAENRMDLLSELDVALQRLGVAAVLAITDVNPSEVGADHGGTIVTVTIIAQEIPLLNRAETGSGKTPQQILVKAISLFARPWSPDVDAWSPAEFAGFAFIGADADTASTQWSIKFNFRTYLETVVHVLATESGVPLVTSAQQNLLISPTPA